MIFLIEYDRSEGQIVTFRNFDSLQRREAEDAQLRSRLMTMAKNWTVKWSYWRRRAKMHCV